MNTESSEPVLFPPMPQPDELSAFFWDGVAHHQLLVMRCESCSTYVHPPKGSCPKCLSASLAPHEMSGRATLVTWTRPVQPFDPYFAAHQPYTFATVNLVEQVPLRFATNIVDCDEEGLSIDLPLVVTFREVAPGCTLPLFRPAS